MSSLFLKIVNISISAGWLILAVLLLRLIFRKAPKWTHVLLWGIVAVRLICPFSIESRWSLIPSAETFSPSIMTDPSPAVQTGIFSLNSVINPILASSFQPVATDSANPLQIWIPLCSILWGIGTATLLLYTFVSCWRLCRRVREATILRENIFQSENVSSPFVLGVIHPKIYLPYRISEAELHHVIAHEQAHIRRRDHWWKPLGFLVLTVYWFHPLMWLAYYLLCRDIELACDQKVIQKLDANYRADYTQALLNCSIKHHTLAACPLAFGEVGVKERIKSVMSYRKPTLWIIILALLACIIAAFCFLTNPKRNNFLLKIVIPAGSSETVIYTEEEISPTRDYIVITAGDGLDNTEVSLKPIEVKTSASYEPTRLPPGFPVQIKAEKGGWFKIGVLLQNPSDQDLTVYLNVENVELRIASDSGSVTKWLDYSGDPSGMDYSQEFSIEIPEFPGVIFRYTPERITASKTFTDMALDAHTILLSGMPIWNVYFCDLTGDGLPELCSSFSMGSGIIDNRVIVIDYAPTPPAPRSRPRN